MSEGQLRLTRKQLQDALGKNHDTIKQFEQLVLMASVLTPDQIEIIFQLINRIPPGSDAMSGAQDGDPGVPGSPGRDGRDGIGIPGVPGQDGQDGVSIPSSGSGFALPNPLAANQFLYTPAADVLGLTGTGFTYAPASGPAVNQATLGNRVFRLASVTTNDDPTEDAFQQKATTTDATVTTLATIPIPASTTVMIEARVTARRTGGTAGTAQDGAAYIIAAAYKNVAGVATEIGETPIFSAEDQAAWGCTITPSGANALLQVAGDVDNNVSWVGTYRTYQISS